MKLEKLDNRVTLEIIVLDRSDIYPKNWQKEHEYCCVFGYRPWDLRKRPFVQLIADHRLEPAAAVTKIDPPKTNRRGYLIYANLPNIEQPAPKPSFTERLASAR